MEIDGAVEHEVRRLGIRRVSPPAIDEDLHRLEDAARVRLPEDYRRFQATYGTCCPERDATVAFEDGTRQMVHRIGADLQFFDNYFDAEGFPPGLVPCGDDVMGNMFFLAVAERPFGSIWWWGYYGGGDPLTDLRYVAPDFRTFLQRIELEPPST